MGLDDLHESLWVFFLLAGLVVVIIWLIVMNRAIDQVSHDIRRMEPGAVWLCLIPLFGLVWQFMVIGAVANGIARELEVRNLFSKEAKPGYPIGLTGCILLCCCIIPYAGVGVAIIGLIFMVIHAVQISAYNKALEQSGRWEQYYHRRMEVLRQQQGMYGYGTPQHWPQQPQAVYQQPGPPPAPQVDQPPPSYYDVDLNPYRKEKPNNPFE